MRVRLSVAELEVLRACEGTVTDDWQGSARQIVEDLCERGLVLRSPAISYGAHPEEQLRQLLATLPAGLTRERSQAAFARVMAAKEAVTAAAGKPAELRAAMATLYETFTEITGVSATRRGGEAYVGRTPVYEDAVRNVTVRLGRPLREALTPPLELLLTSARWLATEVGHAYEERLRQLFLRIRTRTGEPSVPLARLVSALTPEIVFSFGSLPTLVEGCVERFQAAWARVLRMPAATRRHEVASSEIREEVFRESVCEGGDGRLIVSHLDGRTFELFEVLGDFLTWAAMNAFAPVAAREVSDGVWRLPRVMMDRLVISRESWKFQAHTVAWTRLRAGAERFRAARRWREKWGLPERAFYRVATESKPQYVDFRSVVLVDLLGRGIRRLAGDGGTGAVSLSEMLPDLDETWLVDDHGHSYTAEIRVVAVDETARR